MTEDGLKTLQADAQERAKESFEEARGVATGVAKICGIWAAALVTIWLAGLEVTLRKFEAEARRFDMFNTDFQRVEGATRAIYREFTASKSDIRHLQAFTKNFPTLDSRTNEQIRLEAKLQHVEAAWEEAERRLQRYGYRLTENGDWGDWFSANSEWKVWLNRSSAWRQAVNDLSIELTNLDLLTNAISAPASKRSPSEAEMIRLNSMAKAVVADLPIGDAIGAAQNKQLLHNSVSKVQRPEPRVNLSTASWAFETAALELLARGTRFSKEACRLIRSGIEHDRAFKNRIGKRRKQDWPSFRLYDLLAGVAVRFDHRDEFDRLCKIIKDSEQELIFQTRLDKWKGIESNWRRKWKNRRVPVRWRRESVAVVF